MVKPEKFGHLHLVYHFTVPLRTMQEDVRMILWEDEENIFDILENIKIDLFFKKHARRCKNNTVRRWREHVWHFRAHLNWLI